MLRRLFRFLSASLSCDGKNLAHTFECGKFRRGNTAGFVLDIQALVSQDMQVQLLSSALFPSGLREKSRGPCCGSTANGPDGNILLVNLRINTKIRSMSSMSSIPGYVEISEIAKRFKIHYSQAARYVQSGLLPCIEVGRTKLVPIKAVDSFVRPLRGNPLLRKDSGKKRKR